MEIKKLKGRPLHERVIVKLDEVSGRTAGGIIIPDDAKQVANTATIVAVGPLVNTECEDLKVGDHVIIQRMAGFPITIDGETYQMILKNDILFVEDAVDE